MTDWIKNNKAWCPRCACYQSFSIHLQEARVEDDKIYIELSCSCSSCSYYVFTVFDTVEVEKECPHCSHVRGQDDGPICCYCENWGDR